MTLATAPDLSELRELRHQGKLIPFIGAGFSNRFGLPSWSQLIDMIAQELGWDPEVFKVSGSFLQLADYYVTVKGKIGPLRSIMDREFHPTDAKVAASETHQALAELDFPLIYTTNYDTLIERAFAAHGRKYHQVANIDDIASAPRDVTQIVKFHGTFDDDESLVLTESSYFERLDFESAMDLKFRADILGKSLLFIGYGFSASDINIRHIFYKLNLLRKKEHKTRAAARLGYMTTFSTNEIQRALLERWDIKVIELDPLKKDDSMHTFLQALK